jgi:hypothetical protein
MIINLAMGAKWFAGVGMFDGPSPEMAEFQIDRISAYQIDANWPFDRSRPKRRWAGTSDARQTLAPLSCEACGALRPWTDGYAHAGSARGDHLQGLGHLTTIASQRPQWQTVSTLTATTNA